MPIANNQEAHFWRDVVTRSILVLATVAIIVSFLPRNESMQLKYDLNKPWMYNSIIAQFDIPVYKSEERLKQQQDSVAEQFQPYYNHDSRVGEKAIAKLRADFPQGLPDVPAAFTERVVSLLRQLYQEGIMDTPELSKFAGDTTRLVRVVNGKKAESVMVGQLRSTLMAYEQLLLDEQLSPMRQALQRSNLNNYIEPNLIYDEERNETELNDQLSFISAADGIVQSGEKIIDRGEVVNERTYRVLSSFEREMNRRNLGSQEKKLNFIGQTLFVTIMVLLFTIYLGLFRKDYFDKPRSIVMLYVLITLFPLMVSLMISHSLLSVYILPFAIVPIFVRVFMDSRTAFMAHLTMVLICAAAVRYQYEFIIVQLVAGLVAVCSLRELSKRAQVFQTAIIVTLFTYITFYALQQMQNNEVIPLDTDMYVHLTVSGVLLLLAYPLMFLIEKAFGFISSVTLIELSDTNKDLLRRLSEVAPGTFQHSITVGNLASEIANKIGAKGLLVRTGALYHDIGKMANPAFFTENQAGINPHDNMTEQESAQLIISHVTEGLRMAEKYNLPSVIIDFIRTHHGAGMTKYFYIKYKNAHEGEDIDQTVFSYPGPNPFSKEQAILMMADGVEAASRSLNEYTEENIRLLVNRIIDGQVADGFFAECPITFRDIAMAKQVLIERLKNIYHTRISYPTLKSKE